VLALATTGEPDRAASTFARALGLWRGRPYGELNDWPPAVSEANRLDELRLSAEEDLFDARLACGEHREVAGAAESLVNAEPLRERRWEILALAQYRCGRQGDALRTLHRARRTLVEQLGIDPSRRLAALESAILDQDESLDVVVRPAPASEECPYKGLAAYDVGDHDSFFGRDEQIVACLGCVHDAARRHGLLRERQVVVGAGGAGTGPVAARAPGRGRRARRGPDGRPRCRRCRRGAHRRSVRELFGVDTPVEAVRGFCAAIAGRVDGGASVVLAIRADHLTGLAADPDLGKLAERVVTTMTEIRRLIGSSPR
jgi:hypothetical protein